MDGAPTELLIDSYEVGPQTWTEGLEDEFSRRYGYELKNYLPVLAGFVIESHDRTERFLFDFSRMIADLMAENYYGRFAAKCRAAGVRSAVEPYTGPFDGFSVGKDFDVPVGEFWLNQPKNLVRTAASLGHLYSKPYIAAEAFSAFRQFGRWQLTQVSSRRRPTGHGYAASTALRSIAMSISPIQTACPASRSDFSVRISTVMFRGGTKASPGAAMSQGDSPS